MNGRIRPLALALACTACILTAVGTAGAGSPSQATLVLDLNECIRTALQAAPELGEAEADIRLTSSKLKEAQSYRYPQIEVLSLFGPAPSARRSDIEPTVKTDIAFSVKNLTWFTSADLLVTQPLWTFGKISENMKAATHGIEVDKAKKQQKANEVTLEVKKYYYGVLLARELQNVLSELQQYMRQGKEKIQQLIDNESPAGDEMDLFKIDAYSGEINNYMEAALKGERLALAALKARLGLNGTLDVTVADTQLLMESRTIPDLTGSVEQARLQRPEFKQLSEGLRARTALVDAAKANYYPDLFLAGMLSWAYANDRDRIKNPYLSDRFQHTYGGVALGLKWHLDFGITGAKVAAEQAQLNRLESTKAYADTFIPLQIQKAWLEMKEAEKVVESSFIAYRSAKKWGAAALANFDFGIGNPRDIFDAVAVYGKMKAAHYQAIYDYNIAKANLEYAVGSLPPAAAP
ncbi:TolC family protein [Trichlorobacter ammonificans]|uniref:Outer membrane protein TolC n=1 Tax=Trichlorobacter ammonificans TaxID=2916410 RepID=A0ABN8HMW0_9BACT|nr:TolC family protein [Trichlorobacter ammonificans]CAH2032480.1 Outer membrane protein TolC [Trichlorobacter ammonificans]